MAELDANAGIVDPQVKRQAEAEFKSRQQQNSSQLRADTQSALDDKSLAANMLAQAKRMEAEAQGLIAEAARMKKDAERMFPGVAVTDAAATAAETSTTKSRGRKKTVTADVVQ